MPATDWPIVLVITDSTSPVPRTSMVRTFGSYYYDDQIKNYEMG